MRYRIAADLVLLVRFLFAAFAVFGGFLLLDNIHWAWLHLPADANREIPAHPRGMPRQMELIAGVSVLAGNALIYACILAWT